MRARCAVEVSGFQSINQMFFHPADDYIFVLGQGNNPLRAYIMKNDKSEMILQHKADVIKDMLKQYSNNFLSYCMLPENHMIIGTEEGELLYVNNHYELKSRLPSSPFEDYQVRCIVAHSKGFIIGGSNCTFYIYDKNDRDHRQPYTRIERKIMNKDLSQYCINAFTLINDETIILGLENGSFMEVPFSMDKTVPEESFKFQDLVQPFHTNLITDFDLCIRKPLLATCSLDKSVKIWNYLDYSLENQKVFDQEAAAISFHPSGFHLAVAFPDRVKMLNIQYDDIRVSKDINVKGCTELAYSNGGHYVAIANGTIIQLYSVYTGEQITNFAFRGHTNHIKQIVWHPDDLGLISSGLDGQVFEWSLEEPQNKVIMLSQPNSFVTSLDFTTGERNEKTIFTNSTENHIFSIKNTKSDVREKDLAMDQKKYIVEDPKSVPTGAQIAYLTQTQSNKYMFMGTTGSKCPGVIRCYKYPFTGEVAEIQTHSRGVMKQALTADDSYQFSIGEDYNLIIYELTDKEAKVKRDKEGFGMPFSDEYLYDRDKYLKKIRKIEELARQLREMNTANEIKNKTAQKAKEDHIYDQEQKRENQLAMNEQKMATISEEISEMEEYYDNLLEDVRRKHEQRKMELEMDHKAKQVQEVRKYEEKSTEKIQMDTHHKKLENEIIKKHKELIEKQKDDYESQLRGGECERKDIQDKKAVMVEAFMRERDELEERAEKDIEQLKEEKEGEIKKMIEEKQTKEYALTVAKSECSVKEHRLRDRDQKFKVFLSKKSKNILGYHRRNWNDPR